MNPVKPVRPFHRYAVAFLLCHSVGYACLGSLHPRLLLFGPAGAGWGAQHQVLRVGFAVWLVASAVFAATPEPQDLSFIAKADGSEQRYVELLPPGFKATEPHDVLLAFHGHGSDRWQFIRDARG